VPGARTEGRLGFLRFERSDLAGVAIVSILQDRQVSFHIGYIYILSIRWEEYAVSFLLSFVDCGDRFPGDTLIVEWIDIESPISIAHSQNVPIFLVQAQVAGTVIEVNILMFLVGTVLVEEYDRSRYLPGISTCSTDIKKGFAGMSGNYTAREVEFYLLGNLELQTFAFGRCFDNP
jgi:hypothetical protein